MWNEEWMGKGEREGGRERERAFMLCITKLRSMGFDGPEQRKPNNGVII